MGGALRLAPRACHSELINNSTGGKEARKESVIHTPHTANTLTLQQGFPRNNPLPRATTQVGSNRNSLPTGPLMKSKQENIIPR